MNHLKETNQTKLSSRRNFMKIMAGGLAGISMVPVLSSCAKSESPGDGKGVKMMTAAALSDAAYGAAAPKASMKYPFQLPDLPYDYNALEPAIFRQTMEIHHTKHHAGYTKNFNAALEKESQLQDKSLLELLANLDALPETVKTAIRNNGGGYFNHALFWDMMKPNGGGKPEGKLAQAINRDFGSFDAFKEQFSKAAKTLFGSGWAWLAADASGKLEIMPTPNQDTPLAGGKKPVLGLDVWEHAYYLQYQNRRGEYVDNFWSVVNWKTCETLYAS